MRTTLAILLSCLSAFSADVQIIVVGPISCTPFRVMVEREIAPLAAAYPEANVVALLPCTSPSPAPWVVSGVVIEEVAITNALLNPYFALSPTPTYAGWVYRGTNCLMQWNGFMYRSQLEQCIEPYTRKLSIALSNGVPSTTWRVGNGWDLEWGPMPGTTNGRIGRLRKQ